MNPKLNLRELVREHVVCLDLLNSTYASMQKKIVKNELDGFVFYEVNYLKKLIDAVEKKAETRVIGLNAKLFDAGGNKKTKGLTIAYFHKGKVRYALLAGYVNEWAKADIVFSDRKKVLY